VIKPSKTCLILCTGLLISCSPEKLQKSEQRRWEVLPPEPRLTLTLQGRVANRTSESVKAPRSDLRLAWLASEGSLLEPGDVVVRYDTELLDLWLQSNREELAILERRTRAANISNERSLYNLRAMLIDSEAELKSTQLAHELSQKIDDAERGILQRELEIAQETVANARTRLKAIEEIQSLGGAAAAEVRQAMSDYERALANVRVPEVNLAVFDDDDGRFDRMKLDQELVKLGLSLGSEEQHGSLRSRLRVFAVKQASDWQWVDLERKRLHEAGDDAQQVIGNAVHLSEDGGVVNNHDHRFPVPLVPGAELGAREIADVVTGNDTFVRVIVPEKLREAIRLTENAGYSAQVRIPSSGKHWIDGTLESISVVKQEHQQGLPSYLGVVQLNEVTPNLQLGAGVECRIVIDVPEGAVVIPRWWATPEFRPLVRLTDGTTRHLIAQPVGDWLMVTEGLAIGDHILPPPEFDERSRVLFSGIGIPDREEVMISEFRSWDWEVIEMIEDGSEVDKGDILVKLRRTEGRGTRKNSANTEELKAEAARHLARMTANGNLGTAFMDWQKARISAEKARIAYEVDRQENTTAQLVKSQVAARLARLERENSEEEYARWSAPTYTDIRSGNQRAQDRLGMEVARLQDKKASLTAARTANLRNRPDTWSLRQTWKEFASAELAAEQAYKRAQVEHRKALTTAEATYSRNMLSADRMAGNHQEKSIVSPIAGRAYHNTEAYYPIEVGRRLPTTHLMNIPTSTKRNFILHVPASRFRDFQIGETISFYLPALGAAERTGRITHMADFFEKRTSKPFNGWRYRQSGNEDEMKAAETTFRLTVEFNCNSNELVPPGMTVAVELDS